MRFFGGSERQGLMYKVIKYIFCLVLTFGALFTHVQNG
jgi:hypothetical protein